MSSTDIAESARWITHPAWVDPSPDLTRVPLLRRRFTVAGPLDSAVLRLTGLGVWTGTLDGEPLTDAVLEPGSSEFLRRVAVLSVDLTDRLSPGEHELVVELGEGSAHVRAAANRYTKFVGTRYPPRLIADLSLTDDSGSFSNIVTDGSWQTALGSTTLSHWYGGEDHDATLPADPWVEAHVLDGFRASGPRLWVREAPPVRVVAALEPVSRQVLDDGSVLVDFGVNHAGRPVVEVDAAVPAGTRIELWPAEDLLRGHVDQTSSGSPIVDSYVAAGTASRWHPRFCYHGYRYVEVRAQGGPSVLDGVRVTSEQVRSDNARTGSFSCSDETLNQLYLLTDRAVQSNLFSVLTDCPHREKLGWLEEMHLVFPALAHYFDVRPQLTDAVRHMMDAQTPSGLVPDIAPELTEFVDGYRDDLNWGSAIVRVPWHLWRGYGDIEPARRAWPAIVGYLDYADSRLVNGLLPTVTAEWDSLGDWESLDDTTPAGLAHGHGYLAAMTAAAELATELGHDPALFEERAARMRRRLAEEHVAGDGTVGSGSQAGYALALDAGIVPPGLVPRTLRRLYDVLADHRITVGEIALPPLFRVLGAAGRHDLLMALVTQPEGPGYVNMIRKGCTALAETWEIVQGKNSANHFMLGYVVAWFVEDLAGLRRDPDVLGWGAAIVEPSGLGLLESAAVQYRSPAGEYAVRWQYDAERAVARVDVTVPDGATARFIAPDGWDHLGESSLPAGRHRLQLTRSR